MISGKETHAPAQIQLELGDVVQKDGKPCPLLPVMDTLTLSGREQQSLHDLISWPQYSLESGRALYPPITFEKSKLL